MRVEIIGEVNGIAYNPDEETVTLDGEYGKFQFKADEKTRRQLRRAVNRIDEVREV